MWYRSSVSCWLAQEGFCCPCAEPSGPEWRVKSTLGVLGQGMTRSHLFEHLIIEDSRVLLAYGTEIATHEPSKTREFGDMKPLPMRVQLLQITSMVKNAWHLLDLPVL